ncbi:MAG: DNA polymerase III subunit delta' [Deltaproteobacteria bacterium]|nr:DNA polymerase III subunit delta' [Deltaproteobacteria bacterium]
MQPPTHAENDVVIGQDRAVAALTAAVRTNRLAHGLLFAGPTGVGRETCARALARGLLCEKRGSADERLPFGCGSCRACRRVEHGTHPDVTVVMSEAEAVSRGMAEPEGKARPSVEIKIDAIRAFAQTLQKRPYEGRNRVAVVVDAHKMNTQAQNALLKGLEEPGPATILILLVPNARAVLPTISSRCLRLTFAPLSPADQQKIQARKAAGGVVVVDPAAVPDGEGVERLLASLLLHQRGDGLLERLETAAALGRDRAEVDALLALTERQLAKDLRARHLEGLPHSDLDELPALEGLFHARRDLAMNGAVQLVVERLLLGAPASILDPR